jgi:hypothetical protein
MGANTTGSVFDRQMSGWGAGTGSLVAGAKGLAAGLNFGSDLMSAYSYGLKAKNAELQGQLSKWNYDNQAAAYLEDAHNYAAASGDYQKEGMDSAFLRYQQLNSEIGSIRTTSAGSGIDLSSSIVGRVTAQAKKDADWDVGNIQANAAAKASSAISQTRNAIIQSAYATANGKIAQAGAEAEAAAYRASQKYGQFAAWGNLVSGTLNAFGSGATTALLIG